MTQPIFILNAPPQTGKDTILNQLGDDNVFHATTTFKRPMFEMFATTVGLPMNRLEALYDTPGWKDSPQRITDGKTPRDLMIHISENYIKPFFGKDYYGKFLANHIKQSEEGYGAALPWVIPDGGFQEEVDALVNMFGDRVYVIQLEREGHRDFNGDSRNYVATTNDLRNYRFDTSNGNGNVINFIKELINETP